MTKILFPFLNEIYFLVFRKVKLTFYFHQIPQPADCPSSSLFLSPPYPWPSSFFFLNDNVGNGGGSGIGGLVGGYGVGGGCGVVEVALVVAAMYCGGRADDSSSGG